MKYAERFYLQFEGVNVMSGLLNWKKQTHSAQNLIHWINWKNDFGISQEGVITNGGKRFLNNIKKCQQRWKSTICLGKKD